ncbi:agmatinase [Anaerovorax sp. IOR16]|uniref:agmatinase n=1 Tax=Anaerovorax sp. IOR16 TaxID=2773458 RepID=UPI0019D20E7C|nr:agmatinase [Anaerovorax sp. IOR16]
MRVKDEFANDARAWCGLNQPNKAEEEVDIVLFGIPFDQGVSYRAGASLGPSVLRQNTFTSTPCTERLEYMDELSVFDAGDFKEENREVLFQEIQSYVTDLVKKGIFFTAIGGDHSVTIPIEAGINDAISEPFGIIHIDAHMDLCDDMGGDKLSHGSVQRRALELSNIEGTQNLYFIGIRSIEPDEYAFKKENLIQVKTAYDCYHEGMEAIARDVVEKMSKYNKVYITYDIDSLDPAYAAGTGTPQFGGITSRDALELLRILFEELNIIAFDIVEVAPPLDPSLTSMFAARKLLTECWGHQAKKIGKLK